MKAVLALIHQWRWETYRTFTQKLSTTWLINTCWIKTMIFCSYCLLERIVHLLIFLSPSHISTNIYWSTCHELCNASETQRWETRSCLHAAHKTIWSKCEKANNYNSVWWILFWSYHLGSWRTKGFKGGILGKAVLDKNDNDRKEFQTQERANFPWGSSQGTSGFSILRDICLR